MGSVYVVIVIACEDYDEETELRQAFKENLKRGFFGKFKTSTKGFEFMTLHSHGKDPKEKLVTSEYLKCSILLDSSTKFIKLTICTEIKKSIRSVPSSDVWLEIKQSMSKPEEHKPLKTTIPPVLQRLERGIPKSLQRSKDLPDEIDEREKRWLIVGICLHTIISPVLRKYVVPVVTRLFFSLISRNKIHKQTYENHLKIFDLTNTELNYEVINNNKPKYGSDRALYDYRVMSPVDLSKLFLQTHMAHFTAFDDSCDSSALLGIIVNIDKFPAVVGSDARQIRSDVLNPWTHCDFTEWTATQYSDSFQLMGQLIRNLRLSNREENRTQCDLHVWAGKG
ncbi:Hypothetical predicted protein [Mytilus galloprovincialis]|uniref:Uncharacterized protein n=1 Tax=Mytilus galloprovincialis TaxID=29158 RepID=A0A8B6GZU5_MYTGA|nr:Hypothetical predicted protein [Mytilus galloprovincialis]